MKKAFLIGWKDVKLAFRDRAALLLMLAAPFLLTLGLGLVTGRFSGSSNTGISDIPFVIVNSDEGQLGTELVKLFESENMADLLEPTSASDPVAARQAVDEDKLAAVIVIPSGFSESFFSSQDSIEAPEIEIYSNPARPTSVGVITTILESFLARAEVIRAGSEVTLTQLLATGRLQPQEVAAAAERMANQQSDAGANNSSLTLKNVTESGAEVDFDVLAYMAPGMALMFLMFTTTNGGRSLLAEQRLGTLPRLLTTPVNTTQVLGGKVLGIFLTGAAQMLILIVASTLFFQLNWGDPLAVLLLVLSAVVGAVGWGMIITALARTPGQVSAIGSALMLGFGILGGSFINLDSMPNWFRVIAKITPNAWGLDGFNTLALGGRLANILTPILALLIMGLTLFIVSVFIINRRGFGQR